jgi:hypothetical protein
VLPLLSFLLMIAAGWVHRHQLIVIEFLQAENRLLKDRLRGRRIRFTDAERALLARKAKAVGAEGLARARHHRLAGYLVALASALGCAEVEFCRSTRRGTTWHHAGERSAARAPMEWITFSA